MPLDITTIVLLILIAVVAFAIGYYIAKTKSHHHFQSQIPQLRQEAISKSRSVLAGQFSENLAPFLPGFPFNPKEVRFIGNPIDFIAFKGLNEKQIEEIAFIEIKSGNSKLNETQKQIKEAIKGKKISFHEYRIPDKLTNSKESYF
ncbi:MAG: Holliday junction resolvase-like protein [Nanoarchaeota archaeon]|mgnify:CR=1 FL=1